MQRVGAGTGSSETTPGQSFAAEPGLYIIEVYDFNVDPAVPAAAARSRAA